MQYRNKTRAVIFGAAAILWIVVLFFFSGQDGIESDNQSMRFARLLVRLVPSLDLSHANFFVRKLAHMTIFAVEGFLLCLSLQHLLKRRWAMLVTMVSCALIAGANELHQLFTSGRNCNIRDVLLDSFGAFVGLLVAAELLYLCYKNTTMGEKK